MFSFVSQHQEVFVGASKRLFEKLLQTILLGVAIVEEFPTQAPQKYNMF
jgi:hypothetical protein